MKEINKILLSIVLFITGTALSLMTSNIIISSGGCFILGLLLNRPKRTQQKPTSNAPTLPRTTFTRPNPPPRNHPNAMVLERYSPERILSSVRSLRDSDRVGYVAAVQNLRMIDDYGNSWSIGVQSMNWYVSQNGIWVRGLPSSPMRVTAGGGNIFLNRPSTRATTETFRKTTAMRICRHCGAGNEASSLFCINCGHDVASPIQNTAQPKTRACGRCGASVKLGRRFCTKCGAPQPPI